MTKNVNGRDSRNLLFVLLAIITAALITYVPLSDSVMKVGGVSLTGSDRVALGILALRWFCG